MEELQDSQFTPYHRIGSQNFKDYKGKTATLVGEVSGFQNGMTWIRIDNGHTVALTNIEPDSIPQNEKIILEVRGLLNPSGQFDVESYTQMSENFDLPTYYKVVEMMQSQFKDLFY